jgi:hypothetical protein
MRGPLMKRWFGFREHGNPYTTGPSAAGAGQGTAASSQNVARIIGRGASRAFHIYGIYMFGVELVCAKQCT